MLDILSQKCYTYSVASKNKNLKRMAKEMELTIENLVNEIIKYESTYHNFMLESENLFGKESNDFKLWNAKWSVLYNLAKKFDFVDRLER